MENSWYAGINLMSVIQNYSTYASVTTVLLFFVVVKTAQWYFNKHVDQKLSSFYKKHSWRTIDDATLKPCYCSMCGVLMINDLGYYCDCCGVCADKPCLRQADRKLKCKVICATQDELFTHHWIKGNLPINAVCTICGEDCNLELSLSDYTCCWCHRTVHETCREQLGMECDMGSLRKLLIPPWSIQASGPGKFHSKGSNLNVHKIVHPGWSDWMPLIIVANRKSGSNEADKILSIFRYYLNPIQVFDIADKNTPNLIQWGWMLNEALRQGDASSKLNEVKDDELDEMPKMDESDNRPMQFRFLVAGGDGTVAAILNMLHNMGVKPEPSAGILPMGTGNDLSRVLGWGKQTSIATLQPEQLLASIMQAKQVFLDRWCLDITTRHAGIRSKRNINMYNYMSVGLDAQVALDFHRTREGPFYICSSRIFNKLLYLIFGTQQAFTADCQNLQDRLELRLDGDLVEIPSVESIVVLNIPSWGAGVPLWTMNTDDYTLPKQSIDDGMLEVCAIYSPFHIGQLQMGLSQPYRIGQAKVVEITLKGSAPVQVDGEPWQQPPGIIRLERLDQASVLKRDS